MVFLPDVSSIPLILAMNVCVQCIIPGRCWMERSSIRAATVERRSSLSWGKVYVCPRMHLSSLEVLAVWLMDLVLTVPHRSVCSDRFMILISFSYYCDHAMSRLLPHSRSGCDEQYVVDCGFIRFAGLFAFEYSVTHGIGREK